MSSAHRAALYARVSSHDQQTLPMQHRALREYAARRGWVVSMEVKEVGSGASQREMREKLIDAARCRQIDVVLVWHLDRWGRSVADLRLSPPLRNPALSSPPGLLGLLALASAGLSAQVSLGTVVDLAQRNSTAVRLAEADVKKTQAVLTESKDVFVPALTFSTGLPLFPETGFTGTPPSIWSASVSSLVFSIPQKRYIESARSALQAAMNGLKDASEQAALDASTAYIKLDTVNLELEAARHQENFGARLVDIEQQRAEAGVVDERSSTRPPDGRDCQAGAHSSRIAGSPAFETACDGGGLWPPAAFSRDEQLSRMDERQKLEESLYAGLDLAKARLRALRHMQDWLNELRH